MYICNVLYISTLCCHAVCVSAELLYITYRLHAAKVSSALWLQIVA